MLRHRRINKQYGLALLFTSIALLLIASMVTVYTINSIITEQRLLTKTYQSEQAFQAAEAGLNFGLAYLKQNSSAIVVNRGNNKIDGYTFPSGAITALSNGATYTVQYTTPITSNYQSLVLITATGTSSDGIATRHVSQLAQKKSYLAATSYWPLTVLNQASLGGNTSVTNSTINDTIRSGSDTNLSGSASTSGTTTSSSRNNIRQDIKSNDSTLAAGGNDGFFSTFFGVSRSGLKNLAQTVLTSSSNVNYSSTLNQKKNQIIWLEQSGGGITINSQTTIGSPTQPVIMVVNLINGASLKINGGADFYGLLYVIGDWSNSGGGNANFYGNVLVEGSFSSTGNLSIAYDPSVISNLGNFGMFTKVPGSWQDLGG